jgi:hypothetical protein
VIGEEIKLLPNNKQRNWLSIVGARRNEAKHPKKRRLCPIVD